MHGIGSYTAERASALSGVPKSTVYYWAREHILVPTVQDEQPKLWSYADLMALRIIAWLRQPKADDDGHTIPRSSMPSIRSALGRLSALDLSVWSRDGSRIVVDRSGELYTVEDGSDLVVGVDGQAASTELLDVLRPFPGGSSVLGPDLVRPRPHLRIIPGRLGGSPHIERSRVETRAIFALHESGFPTDRIAAMYPQIAVDGLGEAIDLEVQLQRNIAEAA